MITKELLSLVMPNFEVINIYIRKNILCDYLWVETTTGYYELPLSELGRLCKEWCLKQGEESYIFSKSINKAFIGYQCYVYIRGLGEAETTSKNTELEAIIKATEFVDKEKGLLYD